MNDDGLVPLSPRPSILPCQRVVSDGRVQLLRLQRADAAAKVVATAAGALIPCHEQRAAVGTQRMGEAALQHATKNLAIRRGNAKKMAEEAMTLQKKPGMSKA